MRVISSLTFLSFPFLKRMEKEHRGVFGASPLPFSSIGSVYLFWHKTKHEKTTTTKRRKREKRDTHTHTEYHRRPFFSVCLCVYKQSDFSLVHEGGRGKKKAESFHLFSRLHWILSTTHTSYQLSLSTRGPSTTDSVFMYSLYTNCVRTRGTGYTSDLRLNRSS